MPKWIEAITGSLEQKKQYRDDKARVKALPRGHRTAVEGLERYVMYAGGISDGELMVTMLTDLADLFEERAPAGALVRDIVGDDPVERGQVLALVGSNGAGKTTLVKILSTLLTADAGVAEVSGVDVAAAPQHVREAISLTGQFAAVDEMLTGRENLVLVAKLRHQEDPARLADRIAILHEGRIITSGTLADLKALLPPARVECIEKQQSLEDVFLRLVGRKDGS